MHPNSCVFDWATQERGGPFTELRFDSICKPSNMGLEGLVSKRRDRPYQAGRSKHWMKIKNRAHPAMTRYGCVRVMRKRKTRTDSFSASALGDSRH